LIATPQFHHWHHSADLEAYNKNYAGELPLLDMVFGTYHLPKDRLPKTYGVLEMVPTGYFGQLWYPFRGRTAA
jgi:sterol desaturase/sphingolipid hydroxylase (fatty acid hydroxylase superfamily)